MNINLSKSHFYQKVIDYHHNLSPFHVALFKYITLKILRIIHVLVQHAIY